MCEEWGTIRTNGGYGGRNTWEMAGHGGLMSMAWAYMHNYMVGMQGDGRHIDKANS